MSVCMWFVYQLLCWVQHPQSLSRQKKSSIAMHYAVTFFLPYLKIHSLNNAYLLVSYPPLDSPEQRNPRRDASRGCSGWGYLIQSRSFLTHPKYLLASVQTPDLLFQVWAWRRIRRHNLVQTAQKVARQENFSFSPEEVWCCVVKHTFASFCSPLGFIPWRPHFRLESILHME